LICVPECETVSGFGVLLIRGKLRRAIAVFHLLIGSNSQCDFKTLPLYFAIWNSFMTAQLVHQLESKRLFQEFSFTPRFHHFEPFTPLIIFAITLCINGV
jgi:hypothetical protein